jgi:hypothetical protein
MSVLGSCSRFAVNLRAHAHGFSSHVTECPKIGDPSRPSAFSLWPTNEPSPSVVTATRQDETPFWFFAASRSADALQGHPGNDLRASRKKGHRRVRSLFHSILAPQSARRPRGDGACLSADWYRLATAAPQKRVLRPRKHPGPARPARPPGMQYRLDSDGRADDARLLRLFRPEPRWPGLVNEACRPGRGL